MPLLRNIQLPANKGVFPRSILRFGRFRSFWKCRIMLCRGYWVGSLLELVYITTYQAKKQAAISGRLLKALLEELAVNLVLESLASLEDRSVACRNLDFLAGGRIAAGAGIAVLAGESAEADQSNGLAGGDGVDDGSENALNSGSGILLAEFALGSNFLDEFSFVHVNSPLRLPAAKDKHFCINTSLII